MWRDRRLRLAYRGRDGGISVRVVDPLGLVAKASVWYLVALAPVVSAASDTSENAEPTQGLAGPDAPTGIRVFRVTRLVDAELVDEPAHRPTGFDLAAFWAGWCAEFEAGRPLVICARHAAACTPSCTSSRRARTGTSRLRRSAEAAGVSYFVTV